MPANKELLFNMQLQIPDNWCWAANAASISTFYTPTSQWTQCKICCACLSKSKCCDDPLPTECDIPFYLNKALETTQNFNRLVRGPLGFNDIKDQIDAKKIIGARTEWLSGDGHFISIYGYDDRSSDIFIYVGDPIYDKTYIKLDNFTRDYEEGHGVWTHSYLTKPLGNPMLRFTDINESLLTKGRSILPLHFMGNIFDFMKSRRRDLAVAMPHEVYIISLESLKEGNDIEMKKGGVRLIDKNALGTALIYEFDNADQNASLHQIFHGEKFTNQYRKVLTQIDTDQKSKLEKYQLRLIRQPELKVDAFWLYSNNDNSRDEFIPVLSNSFLNVGSVYSEVEFFNLLRRAAENKKTRNNDELLGG